nr:hypothetical protein [Tanacetum cinerariifolium]
MKVLKLRRLQKVGTIQRVETSDETMLDDVSNQGRIIAEMDQDADVVLEDDKEEAKKVAEDAKGNESVDIQGRKAESQAKIYKIDLEHANKVLSMQEDESEPTEVQEVVEVVTTANIITKVVTAVSKNITAVSTTITTAEAQVLTVTLTAAPARVTAAPKQIEEEESRALKRINETPVDKTTKRQKLDEEVEELKRHLQIVPNEDDDVYTEATPLARKVPVVDYEVINMNNKPYYKIIRVDVKRKYPLTRFTLDQMLNAVRLEVEEESEVSLELLRFTRQQHQEVQLE